MIYTSGHEQCMPLHSYGPAVRSGFMFHYIHSGKGIYRVHDRTYSLKADDMFLMKPGEEIYYQADEQDPWVYSWIGFQGIKVEEYIARSTIFDSYVVTLSSKSRCPSYFEQLQHMEIHQNEDLLLNSVAYSFLYALVNEFSYPNQVDGLNLKEYGEEILSYIEQNFERPSLSVQEVADHFSLDRSYIHRIFKGLMNMSIKEYILSLRIANACSYLIHTNLPISTIARSVGYTDVFYFSRLFKKKKGCSPKAYREQKKKA